MSEIDRTEASGRQDEVADIVVAGSDVISGTDDLSRTVGAPDAAASPADAAGPEATVDTEPGDAEAVIDGSEDPMDAAQDDASADADDFEDDSEDDSDDGSDDDSEDTPENPLEVEAEVAADYLEELLDIADLDGDIDTFIEGDRAHVAIVSESRVLVGAGGAVLDALQELTRLAVTTETGNRSRLMLDVAGYRETRRQELLKVAEQAVAQVRSDGGRVALDAMNPFERKIVHDAVAAAGLVSESEGEEPGRHVVVLTKA